MQQTATTPLLLRPLLSLSPLLPLSMPPPPLALVKRSANWRLWTDRGRGLLVWKRLAFLILSPFVRLFVTTQNAQNLPCFLLLSPSCCHWKYMMLLPLFPFSSDSLKNKMFLKDLCNNKQPQHPLLMAWSEEFKVEAWRRSVPSDVVPSTFWKGNLTGFCSSWGQTWRNHYLFLCLIVLLGGN